LLDMRHSLTAIFRQNKLMAWLGLYYVRFITMKFRQCLGHIYQA
jgi:hypothetical protein